MMYEFEINCRLKGCSESSAADTDYGVLYDVSFEQYHSKHWTIGTFSFSVFAENQKEALLKAPKVFDRRYSEGAVNFGKLTDVSLVAYENGENFIVCGCWQKGDLSHFMGRGEKMFQSEDAAHYVKQLREHDRI